MATTTRQEELKAAIRVTLIGSVLDMVLGVLKIAIGIVSSSLALISDGIHSLSDLVTDIFVVVIARFSHAEPDKEHPYGHRRFETLGTIILGIVLFAVAGIICYDSLFRLGDPDVLPMPGWAGILVAIASIGSMNGSTAIPKRWPMHRIPPCCSPTPGTAGPMPCPPLPSSSAFSAPDWDIQPWMCWRQSSSP